MIWKIIPITIIILLLGVIFVFYLRDTARKDISINQKGENYYVETFYFKLPDLYCPKINEEINGRLSRRQCYLPVPCYETGARLSLIECNR